MILIKKSVIAITFIILILLLLNGCSKETQKKSEIFYGETDKWVVIATKENTFKFSYKGNIDDLMKSNPDKKIAFSYGTLQGCTVVTESLSSTTFYEVEFSNNFIKGVENSANSEMNKDNLVKVQINYGKTRDSIKLKEYFAN